MTKVVFILGLLVSANSKSQQINFKCILKFECDSAHKGLDNFSIRKNGSENTLFFLQSNVVLKDTGVYILKSHLIQDDSVFINFLYFRDYTDTILGAGLQQIVIVPKQSGQGDYYCCEKLCRGYITEYFSNGIKKFEGKFRNGYPVGRLRTYYMDGRRRSENRYNRKGGLVSSKKY
ncbi:MAG: hypothetical protein AAB221_08735 [Bacteroidota bacterium]